MVDRKSIFSFYHTLSFPVERRLICDRMFFVIIWWIVSARKWFKGPVINVEVFPPTSSCPYHLPILHSSLLTPIASPIPLFKIKTNPPQHHMLGRAEATVEGVDGTSDSDSPSASVSKKAKSEGIEPEVPEVQ